MESGSWPRGGTELAQPAVLVCLALFPPGPGVVMRCTRAEVMYSNATKTLCPHAARCRKYCGRARPTTHDVCLGQPQRPSRENTDDYPTSERQGKSVLHALLHVPDCYDRRRRHGPAGRSIQP